MKVRHRKGVALHPDPESCGDAREGAAEALTGETAGQPLSREIKSSGVPTLLLKSFSAVRQLSSRNLATI